MGSMPAAFYNKNRKDRAREFYRFGKERVRENREIERATARMSQPTQPPVSSVVNAPAYGPVQVSLPAASRVKQALGHFFRQSVTSPPVPEALPASPLAPPSPQALYKAQIRADALRYSGKLDQAVVAYKALILQAPQQVEAWMGLAHTHKQLQQPTQALAAFREALALQPFEASYLLEAAQLASEADELTLASRWYARAVKLKPHWQETRFTLAVLLERQAERLTELPQSRWQEIEALKQQARKHYEYLVEQSPNFLPAAHNLASYLMREGEYAEAQTLFKRLIEQAPRFSRAYLGLAMTSDYLDQPQQALSHYRQYLGLKPLSPHTPFVLERLADLQTDLGRSSRLIRVK